MHQQETPPPCAIGPQAFKDLLYGDIETGWLTIFYTPNRRTLWFPVTDPVPGLDIQQNCYLGIGIRRQWPANDHGRGKTDHIIGIPGLWLDLDYQSPGAHKTRHPLPPTEDAARSLLDAAPYKPSLIVHSGHGLQVYWLFKELAGFDTMDDREAFSRLCRGWQQFFQQAGRDRGWHVDSTADLAHVLRIPGTYNLKTDEAREVTVREADDFRYDPADFKDFAEPDASPASPISAPSNGHLDLCSLRVSPRIKYLICHGDTIPPPRPIVEGLLHEGMLLFGGKSKRGKSWLMLNLALAVATGNQVWQHFPTREPQPVLYLALEDGRGRIQRRLRAIQPGIQTTGKLQLLYDFPLLNDGGIERLRHYIETWHYRLVILDVLARGNSDRTYHDIYRMFAPLQDLHRRLPFCLAMLTHLRKADAEDIFDTLHGMVAYQGAQDTLWVLERPPRDAVGVLHLREKGQRRPGLARVLRRWALGISGLRLRGEAVPGQTDHPGAVRREGAAAEHRRDTQGPVAPPQPLPDGAKDLAAHGAGRTACAPGPGPVCRRTGRLARGDNLPMNWSHWGPWGHWTAVCRAATWKTRIVPVVPRVPAIPGVTSVFSCLDHPRSYKSLTTNGLSP